MVSTNSQATNITSPADISDFTQLESPTNSGLKDPTKHEIALVTEPEKAITRPWFVDENDQIKTIDFRNMLLSIEYRQNEPVPPVTSRGGQKLPAPENHLSLETLLPIAIWATGKPIAPGQSESDYISIKGDISKVDQFADTLKETCLPGDDFAKVIRPQSGANVVLQFAETIKADPVACFFILTSTLSPREGFGATLLQPAIEEFRKICVGK